MIRLGVGVGVNGCISVTTDPILVITTYNRQATFGTPIVRPFNLFTTKFGDAHIYGIPVISRTMTPTKFANSQSFGIPIVEGL